MAPMDAAVNIGAGVVLGIIATTTIFDPTWLKSKPWYIWIAVFYALLASIGVIAVIFWKPQ
jgi:hypothetical protein